MKGILFLRFPTASLVQAEIDEEIVESGDDIHTIGVLLRYSCVRACSRGFVFPRGHR